MNDTDMLDESSEHVMRTRRRRRDYKSLEDGKDEAGKATRSKTRTRAAKEPKINRNHIVSINTAASKGGQAYEEEAPPVQNSAPSDRGRTSGRWTSEEHKKFVEALKKFGKHWKKVEEYIQTRSGAQIRSHAQKYFLKIQKEYPDEDPYDVFLDKTPEVLEDTIFMKNKGESEDGVSLNSRVTRNHLQPQSPKVKHTEEMKEGNLPNDQESVDFSRSIQQMLARKKNKTVERPQFPVYNSPNKDLLSIRAFLDHVKSGVPHGNSPFTGKTPDGMCLF
jgi:SHAQKYF class myb-like DNA-binding protein